MGAVEQSDIDDDILESTELFDSIFEQNARLVIQAPEFAIIDGVITLTFSKLALGQTYLLNERGSRDSGWNYLKDIFVLKEGAVATYEVPADSPSKMYILGAILAESTR